VSEATSGISIWPAPNIRAFVSLVKNRRTRFTSPGCESLSEFQHELGVLVSQIMELSLIVAQVLKLRRIHVFKSLDQFAVPFSHGSNYRIKSLRQSQETSHRLTCLLAESSSFQ
jgi:hypothetical protein